MMRRILLLSAVALIMALGVAGQAWADPIRNSHNCAEVTSSEFAPEGTREGQWGSLVKPAAQIQLADEGSQTTAGQGNCGDNSVPVP